MSEIKMELASVQSYSAGALSFKSSMDNANSPQILPPIHPRVRSQFGKNPYPNIRQDPDLGSIGSISEMIGQQESADSQENIIRVCKCCQETLLKTFDHCLSKSGAPIPLMSTHVIDEEEDAKLTSSAPYFDIINDPSKDTNKPAFEDPHTEIERDKWVSRQNKETKAKLDISGPRIKGLGVKSGKSFSGAIYKRMLDAKEREITTLRQKLYNAYRQQNMESENVKKLRKALNQSVNFYTFAEEWQLSESSRLKQDIKILKAETSSLMAFLINSEVEKQNLIYEMKELNTQIEEREREANQAIQNAQEMKAKLQESFKEFIAMNETMAQLKKEAIKGTEAVEMRNQMLQKNLTKLTGEFELSTKDLKSALNRSRELEYELEQMVKDLNTKGEALKKSNAINSNLKENLENTTAMLKDLQQKHEQLNLIKSKIESDTRLENAKNEQIKMDLKKTIQSLTKDLEKMTNYSKEIEVQSKAQQFEIDTYKKTIKVLTMEKEDLIDSLQKAKAHSQKEISKRDDTILDLNDKIKKMELQIKTISEKREQLMFQVTDLQNALDTETTNAAQYLEDLNNYKKNSEEKVQSLTEQIEKLNSSKQVLANDKKELTEKIKNFRQNLRDKQEELDLTISTWEAKFNAKTEELKMITLNLETLTGQHNSLQEKYKVLTTDHSNLVSENSDLKTRLEVSKKRQDETENDLFGARNTIAALMEDKAEVTRNLNQSKRLYEELLGKYTIENAEKLTVEERFKSYKDTAEQCIADRDAEVAKLKDTQMFLEAENMILRTKQAKLENTLTDTETKLSSAIKSLLKETDTRELLENQLNENRILYENEKRLRSEMERVQVKLKYVESSRETGHMSDWQTRDRKLKEVDAGLANEAKRLNELVKLLPSEDAGGFGNESLFSWPEDMNSLHRRIKSISKKT